MLFRSYIVRGLEPNTKYYYTMYLNGTSKSTGNFTTLQRFTDVWIDEMMDQYLWSASSGISLKQAYGELPTPDKPFLFNDTKNLTGNYHSVLNINGTWKAFVSHRYANGEVYQGETCNRAAGKFGFFYVYNDSGINFDNNVACTDRFYSHFWVVWDPEYNKYFAIGNNYTLDNQVDIIIDSQEIGNETDFNLGHCISRTDDGPDPPWWGSEPHGIVYDTLGANKFLVPLNDHGQEDSGYPGGSDRRIGLMYILPGNNNYKQITLDDRWQDGIENNGRTGIGLFSQLTEEPNDDEYGMTVTIRNGMYIAFNRQFFEGDETPSGNETICTFLSYSRNGLNWTLFNSTQLIIPEDFDLDNTWHSVRTYGTNKIGRASCRERV